MQENYGLILLQKVTDLSGSNIFITKGKTFGEGAGLPVSDPLTERRQLSPRPYLK